MSNDNLTKLIPLTQGKFAIVDAEDYEWLNQWKWYSGGRYAMRTSRKSEGLNFASVRMHVQIIKTPIGFHTDHINGNGLDNRKENLRACSFAQNIYNKKSKSNTSSQYRGVSFVKRRKKWVASIDKGGKRLYSAEFNNEKEAALAYNENAAKIFGEFARLNIISHDNDLRGFEYF